MRRVKHPSIALVIALQSMSLFSCKQEIPKEVLAPSEMEEVLYDYHLAQSLGNDYNSAERYKRELLVQYVLEKHHTNSAQFDSSLVWYTRNTTELNTIYEHLGERFRIAENNLDENMLQVAEQSESGDTVDVWRQPRLALLTNVSLLNKLTFSITTDTSFHAHDMLTWETTMRFLKKDTVEIPVHMEMNIHYTNDSCVTVRQPLMAGTNTLVAFLDTIPVKELRGTIYVATDTLRQQPYTLLLDRLSLTRMHCSVQENTGEEPMPHEGIKQKPLPEEAVQDTL